MNKMKREDHNRYLDSIEEAGRKLFEAAGELETELLPIEEIHGRILTETLTAQLTQPPFRRSAMDGYAVRYEDICEVTRDEKVVLPVAGAIYAGDDFTEDVPEGSAVKIMTGAPIPDWADVVIPHEMTDRGETNVRIDAALPPNANCVPEGEDFRRGDILAAKGTAADSYVVATAAAGGISSAKVSCRIRASVLTTGSELVDVGRPIRPGQIYNSSKAFFTVRLRELGCQVIKAEQVSDDPKRIAETLQELIRNSDLVITTGGVSVGDKDYLPLVLEQIGAETIFRGIEVKPGSPTMAAKYGSTTILCLSGNPFSAIAMFETLFPCYEQKALRRAESAVKTSRVICQSGYPYKSKRRRLVRGKLNPEGVIIPSRQKNGQLQAGIGCNCLVEIPAGSERVEAGDPVTVHYRS